MPLTRKPVSHARRRLAAAFAALWLSACGGQNDGRVLSAQQLDELPPGKSIRILSAASAGKESTGATVAVAALEKVSETRTSRTHVDYTFRLRVVNGDSAPWLGVQLTLTATGPGTSVIDAAASVGDLPLDAQVLTSDTITIRHDRTRPFDLAQLRWTVGGERIAQTPVGPDRTGVPQRAGVSIARGGATIMAVDVSGASAPRLAVLPVPTPDVRSEFLVGGSLFTFQGIGSRAVGLVETAANVEAVYECEPESFDCLVLPSVGRIAPGRLAFPIQPARLYAIAIN